MEKLDLNDLCKFANDNIVVFHNARLERLKAIKLHEETFDLIEQRDFPRLMVKNELTCCGLRK